MTDRPWKHIAKVDDSFPIAIDCDGIKEFPLEDPNKKKTITDEHRLSSSSVTDPTPIVIDRGRWGGSPSLNVKPWVNKSAMAESGRPNFMNAASQFNSTAHGSWPIVSQADEIPLIPPEWLRSGPSGGGSGAPACKPIHPIS